LLECIGLLISFVGLFISCWSRYLLEKNWSLSVQKKEKQLLIKSGPYSIFRHPIYTGLLLISIGNTFIVGNYRGIIAVLIVFYFLLVQTKKKRNGSRNCLKKNTFNTKNTPRQCFLICSRKLKKAPIYFHLSKRNVFLPVSYTKINFFKLLI
jgi:uncharacterized membrane protein